MISSMDIHMEHHVMITYEPDWLVFKIELQKWNKNYSLI